MEFWFEFASSYSYPAALRVEALARQYRQECHWRPFLLGPIFADQGQNDSPFNLNPAKGRYMWRDLERSCHALGIPFRKPTRFPRNSVLAASLACAAAAEPWLPEYARRVYRANFAQDADISQASVIGECLTGLVDDPGIWIQAAQAKPARAQLRANVTRARELGIFGAPTCVVGQELFWGNDRLEEAFQWALRGASDGLSAPADGLSKS